MKRQYVLLLAVAGLLLGLTVLTLPSTSVKYPVAAKKSIMQVKERLGLDNGALPILMYHHLAPAGTYIGTDNEDNQAIVSVENFAEQMEYLHQQGYQTIFLKDLLKLLEADQKLPDKTVIITFDDGYESNYVYAYPILKKYGLKADISVVVKTSERESEVVNRKPYTPASLRHLTFKQMREMQGSGLFQFQSHTYDGHGLVNVDDKGGLDKGLINKRYFTVEQRLETDSQYEDRIRRELDLSKQVIEAKLADPVEIFCYPFGAYTKLTDKLVQKAGYQGALTVKAGYVHKGSDRWHLRRINIGPTDDLQDFARKIEPIVIF